MQEVATAVCTRTRTLSEETRQMLSALQVAANAGASCCTPQWRTHNSCQISCGLCRSVSHARCLMSHQTQQQPPAALAHVAV